MSRDGARICLLFFEGGVQKNMWGLMQLKHLVGMRAFNSKGWGGVLLYLVIRSQYELLSYTGFI